MKPRALVTVALAVWLGGAAPAIAHDFWIELSDFQPRANSAISVRLRVGEALRGDPMPREAGHIQRFALVNGAEDVVIGGIDGWDLAGIARPEVPGLHWIVYESHPRLASLEPAAFERYLREEGLEHVLAERERRGETRETGRDLYARSAKALIRVGDDDRGRFDEPLGLRLELVPEADPYRMKTGDFLPVRLLSSGRPEAGALVVAMVEDSEGRVSIASRERTGPDGRTHVPVDRAGLWMVKAVTMLRAEASPEAEWRSSWASLTFSR